MEPGQPAAGDGRLRPGGSAAVRIWELRHGQGSPSFGGKAAATAVAFRPDGKALAGADVDGNVTLWNLSNDKPLREWHLAGPALSLRFSHDGRYLITGNGNGTVYVFHLDDAPAPKP